MGWNYLSILSILLQRHARQLIVWYVKRVLKPVARCARETWHPIGTVNVNVSVKLLHQGLYLLSSKMSCHQISWSLEAKATRLDVIMIVSLSNLTGITWQVSVKFLSDWKSLNLDLAASDTSRDLALTHWGRVTLICVSKLNHPWFK